MQSIETTAKTVEEAIRQALTQLDLPRDAVQVEVLQEGSKGLFGLGAKPASVRVTPIAPPEAPKTAAPAQASIPPEQPATQAAGAAPQEAAISRGEDAPQDPQIQVAKQFLEEICRQLGAQVQVQVCATSDAYELRITGDNLGTLIGHRGDTLDALQYLTNLVVNRKCDHYHRIIVDVENYRQKRAQTLEKLALRLAETCRKTGRRMVLEPMNPYERRILHATLQDNPHVYTRSEGEEPNRRVVIFRKQ